MRISSNVTPRGDVYYFRMRVPAHLIEAYGRPMVSVSLHTSDKNTARLRARKRRAELDIVFAELEAKSGRPDEEYCGSVLHLTDDDINRICERYRVKMLTSDELTRIGGIKPAERELDIDIFEAGLQNIRDAYALGDLTDVYSVMREFLRSIKLKIPESSPVYERLARRFQQAYLESCEAILQRRRGVIVDIPIVASDKMTIGDVFKCWLRQKKNRNAKTVAAFQTTFELFKTLTTAPTARLVKKSDAVTFRNVLMERDEISSVTVAKHLSFLRAAFNCAMNDGLIEGNPFDGVKVVEDEQESKEKARIPFDPSELQTIFSGAVYQAEYKPRPSLGAACYWLPLLSLFQGARLEEIAQLRRDSLKKDPEHGWYMSIQTEGKKRVKNASSWRNVPIHPRLIEIGFIDYVESQKTQLFPALRPDKYGKLSTSYSTWFGLYLTSLGITDTRKVFHSFRHSFVQFCKTKARVIPPEVREAIVGHISANKIAAEYGEALYPLEPQVQAMKLVSFPGLDLSHLLRPR